MGKKKRSPVSVIGIARLIASSENRFRGMEELLGFFDRREKSILDQKIYYAIKDGVERILWGAEGELASRMGFSVLADGGLVRLNWEISESHLRKLHRCHRLLALRIIFLRKVIDKILEIREEHFPDKRKKNKTNNLDA